MRLYPGNWILILVILGILTPAPGRERPEKIKLKSVRFSGVEAYQKSRLQRVMIQRPSQFLLPNYYKPLALEEDRRNLELFYNQNGYLEARVTDLEVRIDSLRNAAHVHFSIDEGHRTYIEGVGLFGNQVFSDEILSRRMDLKPGDPLKQKQIDQSRLRLLRYYANRGYIETEITPDIRINPNAHLALVDLQIRESNQYRINAVRVTGLDKTRPVVYERELRFKSGEIINYSRLLQSQRRLYLSGLFESVFIRPVPSNPVSPDRKDILVELKENQPGEFNVSLGYGTTDRVRGRAEILYANLMGMGRKIGITTKLSYITRSLEITFTEPWTFGRPWTLDISLISEYLKQPGFDSYKNGGRMVAGRSFFTRSRISIAYRHENMSLANVRLVTKPEQADTRIRSLKLSTVIDTRDNLYNPSTGTYLEYSSELAGLIAKTTDLFVKQILRCKYFHSWNSRVTVGTAAELGILSSRKTIGSIPLQERFYTGGATSIRGLGYLLAGPLDGKGNPTGGMVKIVWNIFELRRTVYKHLSGAVFLDMGNVWETRPDVHLPDLRWSPGAGLRYDTILGTVRLDVGFNLERRPGEPPAAYWLTFGQSF